MIKFYLMQFAKKMVESNYNNYVLRSYFLDAEICSEWVRNVPFPVVITALN